MEKRGERKRDRRAKNKYWAEIVVVVMMMLLISPKEVKGLSVTVNDVECVYEYAIYEGDTVSGNFVVVDHDIFWGSDHPGIDFTLSSGPLVHAFGVIESGRLGFPVSRATIRKRDAMVLAPEEDEQMDDAEMGPDAEADEHVPDVEGEASDSDEDNEYRDYDSEVRGLRTDIQGLTAEVQGLCEQMTSFFAAFQHQFPPPAP